MATEAPADVAIGDIQAASDLIAPHTRRTPLERSAHLSERCGVDVHIKLECWQPTRSFKVRGALTAAARLSAGERARGLVTASAGNHGQALALAARTVGARAVVFVPRDAPAPKKRRILRLGAQLDDSAADYDAAEDAALAFAERTGASFISAFDDRWVVAGQGTIALELMDELPGLREVIVPVGGGGLAAGIGIALSARSPETRLIGVQSERTRAMYEAYAAGRAVDVPVEPTIADGLAGRTTQSAYARLRPVLSELMLVDEGAIEAAIRNLFVHDGVVAEGAGAAAAAAIESLDLNVRGPAVLIISGGNIEARVLARLLLDDPAQSTKGNE